MLGHEDIADQCKTIACSEIVEDVYGEIPGVGCSEQSAPAIATEGDEMQVAEVGDSSKTLRHRSEDRGPPFENRKG